MAKNLALLDKDELRQVIKEVIREELKSTFSKPEQPQFLTAEDVAKLLKLKPKTVLQKARNGEIPSHKSKRRVYFLMSDIVKYINSNRFDCEEQTKEYLKRKK